MAPEQETGGAYNEKADMFSLGLVQLPSYQTIAYRVVFFELWHPPFKTAMERAIVLTNLLRKSVHSRCNFYFFLLQLRISTWI